MSKPLAIVTEELDDAAFAWLAERCEAVRCGVNDAAFAGLLARADGLVIRTYTRVDAALLAKAPKLKVVGRAGVGLDRVDIPACTARGVKVLSTPDANSSAVAELVFAYALDALRPRLFLDKAIDEARWRALRGELTAAKQLEESTLGILGLGRVGGRVARIGVAMNMRVIYHDLREIAEAERRGASPVGLEQLFEQSDVLTVHIDGRPSNKNFVNAPLLARLKADAVLINTSRGFVMDTAALAEFLQGHTAASAILDVHEPEPIDASNPLLGLANAHLAPHLGAATAKAHTNMSWVVRDVWRVLSGETPEFPAN